MGPSSGGETLGLRSIRKCASVGTTPSKTRSSNLSAMRHWTRVCSSSRSSASCRQTIRASRAPSRQLNARSFATDLSCAMTPAPAWTACRPAKALSSPAASGLSTTMCCWGGTTRRQPCSSACWRCATRWGCSRSNTILTAAVSLATSRRPSRIWRSSTPPTASTRPRERRTCALEEADPRPFSQGRGRARTKPRLAASVDHPGRAQ